MSEGIQGAGSSAITHSFAAISLGTVIDGVTNRMGFRNGPLGVKPPSDDLATVIVLPFVVDTRVATSCHQMGCRRANLENEVCLVGGHRPSYGFTGSASR